MVLLVDDQPMICEAVRRALSNQPDIDFHYCGDPTEAINIAQQIKPTVILQDLVMPGMDGLFLVQQFRNNPTTHDVPIIVLSTNDNPHVKSHAFSMGANDYIVKLPDRTELVARVRYHTRAYLNQHQRDYALHALRESQSQLLETNTTLISLNQKLEESTSAKAELLTNITREIRAPASNVIAMTALLLDSGLTGQQRQHAEAAHNSGETLLTIINDMLDPSNTGSGKPVQ